MEEPVTDGPHSRHPRHPHGRYPRHPQPAAGRLALHADAPAPEVAHRVERHWIVSWDLRGRPPYTQHVLPHPCVNVVFEQGKGRVFGLVRDRFSRRLEGAGTAVGPKWVLQRYRLHEAAERMAAGEADDLTRLALDLGYFDLAHFTGHFRRNVGRTPAASMRACAAA